VVDDFVQERPPKLAELFSVVDPLGNTIRCTRERWDSHVINQRQHLELLGHEQEVREVFARPHAIFRATDEEFEYTRYIYFRRSELPPPHEQGFIQAVADLVPSAPNEIEGRFVTAYHTFDGPGEEDEVIWLSM
jgi:hypothetical protein